MVDPHGEDLPPSEAGEILIRGPVMSPGYWRRAKETAATFRDGWMHTGDAGRLTVSSHLSVVDQVNDMIVTGGENVYSTEVESALAAHDAVARTGVIGIPDERWGDVVHAVVVRRPGSDGVDEAALRAHCRALIAGHKVPKRIEFVDELPLTPAGKVNRAARRTTRGAHLAHGVN